MTRSSILIMGGTLSTNESSSPIVSRDWCDKGPLYQAEAGCHLQSQRDRSQEQQDRDDPGVIGSRDRDEPSRLEPGCDLPPGVADDHSNRRPGTGRLRQPTTHRKQSHLASLLPWVRRANGAFWSTP